MQNRKNIHYHLLVGVKSGSHEDFNRLYVFYADLLYGFVLNLTKSPSKAEDILQETFLRVWQNHENISLEMSFKSYLYTIAHNLIINSFRNQISSISFDLFINSDTYQNHSENHIEQAMNFDDFKKRLDSVKEKMTDKQKVIFELHKEKGYTIEEIANKFNISEKTVKNQLSLALKILKKELGYYYLFILLFL